VAPCEGIRFFDTTKIVLQENRRGGIWLLMTGMLSPAEGLTTGAINFRMLWQDQGPIAVRVAAIVNYFGAD